MVDVAISYALMRAGASRSRVRWPSRWTRSASRCCDRFFAKRYVGPAFYRRVAEMAELKCFDTNMAPDEIRALRKMAAWAGAKAPG